MKSYYCAGLCNLVDLESGSGKHIHTHNHVWMFFKVMKPTQMACPNSCADLVKKNKAALEKHACLSLL